jgi:hypothetical protein
VPTQPSVSTVEWPTASYPAGAAPVRAGDGLCCDGRPVAGHTGAGRRADDARPFPLAAPLRRPPQLRQLHHAKPEHSVKVIKRAMRTLLMRRNATGQSSIRLLLLLTRPSRSSKTTVCSENGTGRAAATCPPKFHTTVSTPQTHSSRLPVAKCTSREPKGGKCRKPFRRSCP